MTSPAPFSIRLSKELGEAVAAEAKRTKRSKGAVLEALAEEAFRMRRFPGIAFRGDDWSRRPWVIGTAFDVWEVIQALQDFGSFNRLLREGSLTAAQVALAESYYRAYPDEVKDMVRENRTSLEGVSREFPTFSVDPSSR